MVARSSIYKCDVMKTFLLGYLYFYITIYICSVMSLDLDISWESRDGYVGLANCTECNINPKTCVCWENYLERCVVCCSDTSCCSCDDCSPCWEDQRRLLTMTQIGISILFGFGFIGLIVIYCKICNRRRRITQARSIVLQEERDMSCNTIENLRDRPPPYNETFCSAPPLYTSPYNRASMQEAPPSYPGTPKSQERSQELSSRHSVFVASSVAQHM